MAMDHPCDAPQTLMSRTIELLKDDPRSLPVIAQQSGVPFYWVTQFGRGVMNNPSVNRVQALYEFLTGKKLDV